jgi:hypothetical protein
MALKMKKSAVTPLKCAVAQKRARNPFAFRTYIFKGLKLPWNQHLQKNTRGCPLRSLQTRELSPIFHPEARISYKSLDLNQNLPQPKLSKNTRQRPCRKGARGGSAVLYWSLLEREEIG